MARTANSDLREFGAFAGEILQAEGATRTDLARLHLRVRAHVESAGYAEKNRFRLLAELGRNRTYAAVLRWLASKFLYVSGLGVNQTAGRNTRCYAAAERAGVGAKHDGSIFAD